MFWYLTQFQLHVNCECCVSMASRRRCPLFAEMTLELVEHITRICKKMSRDYWNDESADLRNEANCWLMVDCGKMNNLYFHSRCLDHHQPTVFADMCTWGDCNLSVLSLYRTKHFRSSFHRQFLVRDKNGEPLRLAVYLSPQALWFHY